MADEKHMWAEAACEANKGKEERVVKQGSVGETEVMVVT